jgi:hypothetical protein
MGLPYSREIYAAVDKLPPLIAAAQTTKNIFILLVAIQVVKVIILALTLLAILALLITMNSHLEDERAAAVTPVVKWIVHRLARYVPAMYLRRDIKRPRIDCVPEKVQ